jgi:heparosan-N-sulfate-glucuronate 5-epimerase
MMPRLRRILPPRMSRVAKFLSTEESFRLPLGSRIGDGAVAGYYIDMRVKASRPALPAGWATLRGERNWDMVAQWALGCHEHYLESRGERWLAAMRAGGDLMLRNMDERGGLWHSYLLGHTFPILPPSLSAMAQGQAASVLVRLHIETGSDEYAAGALRALQPLYLPTPEGGTRAFLDGGPWLEEYPTEPPSYVLNGGLFAIWGLYDAAVGLGDSHARSEFDATADTFARNADRWDTGSWSRYDLFPHPFMVNVASPAYHALHVNQLRAMQRIAPRAEVAAVLERFERYAASGALRARAFVGKSLFRLAVPRNKRLARVWPGPTRRVLRGA